MPTALDLFCGAAGGWSLGLHRAGVTTVAACEIDEWRRSVFSANNPNVRMYADVRELTATRLMDDLGCLPDWVVGSPPCQDASTANTKGRGVDGARTGLFFEAIRLIDGIRPSWACLENVPGIRTRGADRVLSELEAIGYACWPVVVGAWHAGAPHRRNRVWFIAADMSRDGRGQGDPGKSEQAFPDDSISNENRKSCRAEHAKVVGELERDVTDAKGWGSRTGQSIAQSELTGVPRYPISKRLEIGESVGCDARPELSAIERAVGPQGIEWNGGPARHLGMADGLSSGVARACISAFGDAVMPQITEAIARTILQVSAA